MDPLEFCIKSLSYPLGLILEKLPVEVGGQKLVVGETLRVPELQFLARCYLVARGLYEALPEEEKERLAEDIENVEGWKGRFPPSSLSEPSRKVLENPKDFLEVERGLSVDWVEYGRRVSGISEEYNAVLEAYRKTERSKAGKSERKGAFMDATADILGNLNVEEALLLAYLVRGNGELEEFLLASLGKHNRKFHDVVVEYFRGLSS